MPLPHLALLVVDAQPVFLDAIPDGAALGDSCRFVVEAARALDIRVAFSEQRPDKLGATRADIRKAAPVAPVFPKSAFSTFQAEGFDAWIRDNDISHLLIAGLETPICVYQTVLGALAEGIDTTVLTDATGGRRAADHDAALRALEKKSECHLLPSETIFYSILGDASHPAFKAVSALVKARGEKPVAKKEMPVKKAAKKVSRQAAKVSKK